MQAYAPGILRRRRRPRRFLTYANEKGRGSAQLLVCYRRFEPAERPAFGGDREGLESARTRISTGRRRSLQDSFRRANTSSGTGLGSANACVVHALSDGCARGAWGEGVGKVPTCSTKTSDASVGGEQRRGAAESPSGRSPLSASSQFETRSSSPSVDSAVSNTGRVRFDPRRARGLRALQNE
jgi:hypothetical protein